MKIIITDTGNVMIEVTDYDKKIVADAVVGTSLTPRKMLEMLAEQYSANLEQDVSDLRTYFEEGN